MTIKRSEESGIFDAASGPHDLARIFLECREQLAAKADSLGGLEMMQAYTDLTDELVHSIFETALDEAQGSNPRLGRRIAQHIAIAAVGGYGRREMSPFSDVDVAFVADSDDENAVDLVVKRAFRILMDTLELAGLKVGYSYRRVDEVENLELEAQTALFDARCVAGSVVLFNSFQTALQNAIVPAAFVIGHVNSRKSNGGSDDTPFVVEPNVKEGHGGLRDLHSARWIAQVTFGFSSENVWSGLRARGILLDSEIEDTHAAAEFVSRVRNYLHIITGRGNDTLSVARHEQISESMNFARPTDFIATYFAYAHRLWRVFHKVARACLRESLQIEPGVIACDGRLHIRDRGLLLRDSTALPRLFLHAELDNLEIDREAGDLAAEAARVYQPNSGAGLIFLDILAQKGVGRTLRSMADLGVLQTIVPRFGEMMYLVPGDAAHSFTVGEHSLRTVEQLEALLAEDNEQYVDIFSRVQQFEVLFLAALLHDYGKLDSTGDHAKTGAKMARVFAQQLGMADDACARVEFLIKYHLLMGETARLRDLHQPKTIRDFATIIKDPQLLDMLFLLTVADYRSVGTRHWSQVQIRFLLELHNRAAAAIRSPDAIGADLERHRKRVQRELSLANIPPGEVDEHCASMPASYLLNTPPDELAAHIGYVRTVREGSPIVEVKDDRAGEFTQLTVVADDRAGLLSDIAGVLHAMGVDIHAAQIFTRHSHDHIAIDILYVDFEGRQLAETKKWQLEGELPSVLSGQVSVNEMLSRWRKKPLDRLGRITVKVPEGLSDHHTVLDIRADDASGLLHYLTRKIAEQGLTIHSARVATWGHEARDAFYVTDNAGDKLSPEQIAQLQQALAEEI